MSGRLEGKVLVVTGGTSGIGAEVARRVVSEGAHVVVSGRSPERGRELVDKLGGAGTFVAADLTAQDGPEGLVKATLDRHGRLDTLVNNAAMDHTGDLLNTPLEEARRLFEINYFAAFRMLQLAAGAMERGGSIINVTSRLASIGVPQMASYSASKGALLALTTAAAVELGPRGIRVNAVAPGMTRTPLYGEWLAHQENPEGTEREVVAGIPLGEVAEPWQVAAAVAFLASSDAAHVTGASLAVDGGYTAA